MNRFFINLTKDFSLKKDGRYERSVCRPLSNDHVRMNRYDNVRARIGVSPWKWMRAAAWSIFTQHTMSMKMITGKIGKRRRRCKRTRRADGFELEESGLPRPLVILPSICRRSTYYQLIGQIYQCQYKKRREQGGDYEHATKTEDPPNRSST